MISLLIWLLVAIVIMWIIWLVVTKFIADATLRTIILLIFGLIFLLIILNQLGIVPGLGGF